MLFRDFVTRYLRERDLESTTAVQYRCTVSNLDKWHGSPVDIENDLTTDLINDYLHAMKEAGRSSYTRKSRRNNLIVLWRALQDDPRIPFNRDYRYIQRVATHELEIECFTPADVERFVSHCRTLDGVVPNTEIPWSVYWRSYGLVAWDSALRKGDLLRFTPGTVAQIVEQAGCLNVFQHKVKRYVECFFMPGTIDALHECLSFDPGRSHVWPQWSRRSATFYDYFKAVVAGAGLTGTSKYLRRGAATDAESNEEGAAAKVLGHSPRSRGVAEKFYVAKKHVARRRPPQRTVIAA